MKAQLQRLGLHDASPWLFRAVTWCLASVITALIGPFTTYGTWGFADRFAYWGAIIGAGMVTGYTIRALMIRFRKNEDLVGAFLGAAWQSIVLGPTIWAFNLIVIGFDVGSPVRLVEHVLIVFAICLAVIMVRARMGDFRRPVQTKTASDAGSPGSELPGFMARLDTPVGGQLKLVSANDHYLRVLTDEGEGRLRMRFRDALDHLEQVPGYRVHRSHWVARDALVRVNAIGRRHIAELDCGTRVPVSQAYMDDLRRDGLLD